MASGPSLIGPPRTMTSAPAAMAASTRRVHPLHVLDVDHGAHVARRVRSWSHPDGLELGSLGRWRTVFENGALDELEAAPGHAELSREHRERLSRPWGVPCRGPRIREEEDVGVFPPSSPPKRLRCLAPAAITARPVAELPVRLITGTSGENR